VDGILIATGHCALESGGKMNLCSKNLLILTLVGLGLNLGGCRYIDEVNRDGCVWCGEFPGEPEDEPLYGEKPPRYEEREPDPGRAEEIENGRDRERESRGRQLRSPQRSSSLASRLARHYGLEIKSAQKLAPLLVETAHGDLQRLLNLGISHSELMLMAQGQNPSAATLRRLSNYLQMDLAETHELIQNMKHDLIEMESKGANFFR